MIETYNSKGIILNRYPYRENDLRVILYNENYGKMELIAKGGLKSKSKLAGHIEPIVLIDAMIIFGKKINYICTAINRNCYVNIKNDSLKLFYASLAIKTINKQNKSEDSEYADIIFALLKDFLDTLEEYESTQSNYKILYSFFLLKFLTYIGFSPNITHCCQCQKKIKIEQNYFAIDKGGLVCRKCFYKNKNLIKINNDSIKILKFIIANEFKKNARLKIERKIIINNINHIIESFFRYNMESK